MAQAQALEIAAPGTEEMTKVAGVVAGASITGVVQGIIVKMAPGLGAAAPIVTWGSLLGTPIVGIGGALFTRGILGDLLQGIAAGSSAILGYTLPAMLAPDLFGRKGLTAEQRAALAAGRDVKQLRSAAERAQEAAVHGARSVVEF